MKLIEKLAIDAVKDVDYIFNENRRCYGEGFMAGFRAAREMAKGLLEADDLHLLIDMGEQEEPTSGAV